MCRWYLAYACTPESSRGFSTFSQCWLSHICHLSLLPLHTLTLPLCKRKELQLLLFYRLRRAYMTRQKLHMFYLYPRDHLIQMYQCPCPGLEEGMWLENQLWCLILYPDSYLAEFSSASLVGKQSPILGFPSDQDTHRRLQGLGEKKPPKNQTPKSPKHLTSITRVPRDKKKKIHFCFTCFLQMEHSQTRKLSL